MGSFNIVFTEEEKRVFLQELLEKLRGGENRTLRLSKEMGIATTTVKRFKEQLISERENYS